MSPIKQLQHNYYIRGIISTEEFIAKMTDLMVAKYGHNFPMTEFLYIIDATNYASL